MNASQAIPVPGGGPLRRQEQDFDLNLAPIIDCFTVLIAFVMISTAFASVGILEAGMVTGGAQPIERTGPEVKVRLDLQKSGAAELHLIGKESHDLAIPAKGAGLLDHEAIAKQLIQLKTRWPGINQLTLAAANDVPYRDVVAAMETARKTIPGIALGGF